MILTNPFLSLCGFWLFLTVNVSRGSFAIWAVNLNMLWCTIKGSILIFFTQRPPSGVCQFSPVLCFVSIFSVATENNTYVLSNHGGCGMGAFREFQKSF